MMDVSTNIYIIYKLNGYFQKGRQQGVRVGSGMAVESGLFCNANHSWMVYESPMDKLQRLHRGIKFSTLVGPPCDSGILCPQWKSNTFMGFSHHGVEHLVSNTFPAFWIHTCSRSALRIGAFFFLDVFISWTAEPSFGIVNRDFTRKDFGRDSIYLL